MAKSTLAYLIFLFLCTDIGVAFQVSSPLQPALSSPVLVPRPQYAPLSNNIRFQQKPSRKILQHDMMNNDDLEPKVNLNNKNKNVFAKFGIKLKKTLSLQPLSAFFLSISIFLLPFFTLSAFPDSASAVQSGGRMGGSCGGGRSSSSRMTSSSSRSRSYSAPSRSRSSGGYYSRGYNPGGYSSRGYNSWYNRGYSRGYYSRPNNVIVSPGVGGVVVSRGPSFGTLFFIAGFFLLAAVSTDFSNNGGGGFGGTTNILKSSQSVLGPGVSVAEISVALDVPDRDCPNSILSALNRLSRTARTDSRVGLQNLTSQVAIELLRRKLSIVAASTSAKHYRDGNKAQREYNNISIQERGKFQRETVSKYGGVDYSDARIESTETEYSAKATVAVVTIVMMIDGDSTSKQLSSKVNSIQDVADALGRIAADAKADNCLRGAEILWTPEERDETLTMREVFADYSSLRSL